MITMTTNGNDVNDDCLHCICTLIVFGLQPFMQVQATLSSKRARDDAECDEETSLAKKARVECDVSANFDLTGLGEESTGESDSDFDLDYTVV